MRPSKLFILLIILLETLTVFCLGILSNQISNLFTLPAPLLLILAGAGITGMTLIVYFRYSHAPEKIDDSPIHDRLTVGEVWRRLKPRKRHKYLFKPTKPRFHEDLIGPLLFMGLMVLGLATPFLWELFPQLKLNWHRLYNYGLFCLIAIPILAIFSDEDGLLHKLGQAIVIVLFFNSLILGMIAYGYFFLYILLLLRWLVHLFI